MYVSTISSLYIGAQYVLFGAGVDLLKSTESKKSYLKWDSAELPTKQNVPIGLALTRFHTLLIYDNMLQAVCRLNNKVVYEREFAPDALPLLDITTDQATGRIALYSKNSIFYLDVYNEGRDIWRLYLEKNDFEKAMSNVEKPEHRDEIAIAHAEFLYNKKSYIEAARKFAYTTYPLEDIVLRLARANQRDALKEFLVCKLKSTHTVNDIDKTQRKTQRVMIAGWLTELYLSMLTDAMVRPTCVFFFAMNCICI